MDITERHEEPLMISKDDAKSSRVQAKFKNLTNTTRSPLFLACVVAYMVIAQSLAVTRSMLHITLIFIFFPPLAVYRWGLVKLGREDMIPSRMKEMADDEILELLIAWIVTISVSSVTTLALMRAS